MPAPPKPIRLDRQPSLSNNLHGLYVITPELSQTTNQLVTTVRQALAGGARIVQYRNKEQGQHLRHQQALALRELCHDHAVAFIINDDPHLAQQVHADGVHLGRDDMTISAARELLGEQAIIGISCYNQLDNAIQAEQAGANYIAFGSFYSSPTKPQAVLAELSLLPLARQVLSIPIVAIGGITVDNGAQLIAAGATTLAIISGVFSAPDNSPDAHVTAAAQAYTRLFNNMAHEPTL